MHHIQQAILKKMLHKESATFSQLQPAGISSNVFSYHLASMLDQKYLKKNRAGEYCLASLGQSLIDRMSSATLSERIQPKIVTLIVCTNMHGDFLFYRRKKQPYFKKVGFPYGKIHLGERIADAASREFSEKTGLSATLHHCGEVYITVYDAQDELFTHTLFHIFSAKAPRGILETHSPMGESFWADIKDIPVSERMHGLAEIVRLLQKKKRNFFEEFIFTLKSE